jgi:NDP-sugar pyrophosphorylase family protein
MVSGERVMRPKALLVLAGGFGSRLRSAVSDVPKPLAPVVGKPYLQHLIESWIDQGVTKFIFLLHYKADLIEEFLLSQKKNGRLKNCEMHILIEQQPLGTGGAVAYAVKQFHLTESFLVTNADTWLQTGINQAFESEAPAMAVLHVENSERYGSVKFELKNIISFEEKLVSSGKGWINAGLYHLSPDFFGDWNGQPFSLERELFPKLVVSGQLQAIPLNTEFIDIGIPEDYYRFCHWVESGKVGTL